MKIVGGILENVKLLPTPNKGGSIKPRLLVIHDTAGALNSAGSISWLRNPAAKASAHFVIGREGDITQLASCNIKTWHAGVSSYKGVNNVNAFSIGIELVNPGLLSAHGPSSARASFGATFSRAKYGIEERAPLNAGSANLISLTHPAGLWMPYTEAQLNALLAVALAIKDAYGITEVAPHWFISPGRKIDTNPLFPLQWFKGKLLGRQDEDPPLYPIVKAGSIPVEDLAPLTPGGVVTMRGAYITGGVLRRWPSFYPDNIVDNLPEGHGPYKVTNELKLVGEGEDLAPDLRNLYYDWYKVEYHDPGLDNQLAIGYVLKTNQVTIV